MKSYSDLLKTAINDLFRTHKELLKACDELPYIPLPRFKRFQVLNLELEISKDHIKLGGKFLFTEDALDIIVAAKRHPRKILRALRQIQAATAWCNARAEGRRRAAQEILRQQQKAVEALESEQAMAKLGGQQP